MGPRASARAAGPESSHTPWGVGASASRLPEKLEAMYRDHADFVLRVACQLGLGPGHAEDAVHDVFLAVHRRLHEYDGRSLRSWLYGITRRVVARHRRSAARAQRREHDHAPVPRPPADPEHGAAMAGAVALVERFVATLDEGQRVVFVLADIEGTPVPEIAAGLGLNLNTVYSRLRLARRRFEAMIADVRSPEVRDG